MLSDKLKQETQYNHQKLEKSLINRLKSIRSVEGYISMLRLFYGYFGGLETLINKLIDVAQLPDSHKRRKTKAIAEDIMALNSAVPNIATADAMPHIQNHLEALGALYVIEGSTLGGKIISKMMQQQLGLTKGLSFFAGYGNETDAMWQSFKDVLNSQTHNPEQEALVIAAANETFLKFGEWIEKVKE